MGSESTISGKYRGKILLINRLKFVNKVEAHILRVYLFIINRCTTENLLIDGFAIKIIWIHNWYKWYSICFSCLVIWTFSQLLSWRDFKEYFVEILRLADSLFWGMQYIKTMYCISQWYEIWELFLFLGFCERTFETYVEYLNKKLCLTKIIPSFNWQFSCFYIQN